MMLSDVCLSVCRVHRAQVENREAYRKTKTGTQVAHVTRDSDTTFKVKRSKVNVTGSGGILWRLPHNFYALPLIGGGIKRRFCLTSVCRVHRA